MSESNFAGCLGCCLPEFSPLFLSDAFVFEISEMGTTTAWLQLVSDIRDNTWKTFQSLPGSVKYP